MRRKSKAEEQSAKRRKLKESRRSTPDLGWLSPSEEEKPSILIVCEGENTEPSYFNQFRLTSATVTAVGNGCNTVSLVEQAEELSSEGKYEQVWCVFDKDNFNENNFNDVIELAEKYGFGVAYSNQAFEYWLILHFDDHQGGGMDRKGYNSKINRLVKRFNITYDGKGNKKISPAFFEIMEGVDKKTKEKRVDLAITRAKRNHEAHKHETSDAKKESTTTVYKLVDELLKHT